MQVQYNSRLVYEARQHIKQQLSYIYITYKNISKNFVDSFNLAFVISLHQFIFQENLFLNEKYDPD